MNPEEDEVINFVTDNEGNIILSLPIIPENQITEDKLDDFLKKYNLMPAKQYLTEASIDYESLRYLSKEDIKEAIPPIGLRARFRETLFSWRKSEFGIDDDTLSASIASKVVSWLGSQTTTTSTITSVGGVGNTHQLSKKLKLILLESLKGKAVLDFYETNGHLIDSFRTDLINIILDDVYFNGVKLSPKDFPPIIEEILDQFPSEIKVGIV